MTSTAQLIRSALTNPNWLAHRYDERHDAVHLIEVDRAHRRGTPFLSDQYLGPREPFAVTRADTSALRPGKAPVHFIFHSAFCCSTLLASACDLPGVACAFSEPQVLNDMVGWRHRRGDPAAIERVLGESLGWLTPFAQDEVVVIKTSNVCNALTSAMLRRRPDARAVFLYAPIRVFLTSIARKGMDGRLWVRELLQKQLRDGMVDLGFEPDDYLRHTDLQAAAVGWLAQQKLFGILIRHWPARLKTLDSETLVARPIETLTALSTLYGLRMSEVQIASQVAKHFTRNSKDGSSFASGQRAAEREAGAALHADEIEKVAVWAEAVAKAAGVPMDLGNPLI